MAEIRRRRVQAECGYCLGRIRGYSSITMDDERPVYLCHGGEGPDCYRLVTEYRKPLADGRRLSQNGLRWVDDAAHDRHFKENYARLFDGDRMPLRRLDPDAPAPPLQGGDWGFAEDLDDGGMGEAGGVGDGAER